MRFSLKGGRSTKQILFPDGTQHPDLPLSPKIHSTSPKPEESGLDRRATTSERFTSGYAGDRRSIAFEPGYEPSLPPDPHSQEPVQLSAGLTRSQTVWRREGVRRNDKSAEPSPSWSPDYSRLPTPTERPETAQHQFTIEAGAPMNQYHTSNARKTSADSGQSSATTDRWTQRRLQRLNTEQGFREQRQGGQATYSAPVPVSDLPAAHTSPTASTYPPITTPNTQPHPAQPSTYHGQRSPPTNANADPVFQAQPVSSLRPNTHSRQDSTPQYILSGQRYSPPDANISTAPVENQSSGQPQSRSYPPPQPQQGRAEEGSMSSSNNGGLPAPKLPRSGGSNRQSMHNGLSTREAAGLGVGQQSGGQQQGGVPAFNASVVPPSGQAQAYQGNQPTADTGRTKTPQPLQTSDDMTDEEVNQLIKDHKELREKYTKVKKYYFEKEDQVKQLQNSLAHQRLSQSRTSLDDSEYTTRFNRLDGLIAQLAFAIRKSWRSVPPWLAGSVNKDAITTGKQEMTAAGRALISSWLVDQVFEKYFHPDLDPMFSARLKTIQRNIRVFAPFAQTAEEEEYLTSKVVNWRLSTLEGLQEELRSPQCAANRAQLTDTLKQNLVGALATHLQEPAPPDLEGGVHMIIELVVSIASHLPLESRDVVIEYFTPGYSILTDHMKVETGIPPLTAAIAEDATEHGDTDEADTDDFEDVSSPHEATKKRGGMLSALTGAGSSRSKGSPVDSRKHAGAGNSTSSLTRPESAQDSRQDHSPRVRMAAGIGVQIRGRSVLVKAAVFATS